MCGFGYPSSTAPRIFECLGSFHVSPCTFSVAWLLILAEVNQSAFYLQQPHGSETSEYQENLKEFLMHLDSVFAWRAKYHDDTFEKLDRKFHCLAVIVSVRDPKLQILISTLDLACMLVQHAMKFCSMLQGCLQHC